MAYKTFVAGEEALAADVNAYLMAQTVARFANASARTAAIPAPALNQLSQLDTAPGVIESWDGSAWRIASSGMTVSATPPTAPTDGQLWAISPATGIIWLFRYNAAASTYKWEFVGGAPLIGYDASTGSPASGSWALGAPAVTVPRAGIYTASGFCLASSPSAARVWMGVTSGSASAPFTDAGPTVAASAFVCLSAPERETNPVMAAGGSISATYTASIGGTSVANRQIRVVPRAIS